MTTGTGSLAAALLLCLSGGPAPAQPAGGGNVQRYDLGRLEKTADLRLSVPFRNSTGCAIGIDSVQGSCACLVSFFEPAKLDPGEVGHLNVDLDLASKRGHFQEEVTLYTDRLDNSRIVFGFSGYVLSDVEVRPDRIMVLVPDSKAAGSASVTLESTKAPLLGARICDPPEWLAYRTDLIEAEAAAERAEAGEGMAPDPSMIAMDDGGAGKERPRRSIRCTFRIIEEKLPKAKKGTERLVFETDPPSADPVSATVDWQRETMYRCAPKAFELSMADGGCRSVTVERVDGRPFNVESAAVDSGTAGLRIGRTAMVGEAEWEIELLGDAEGAPRLGSGALVGSAYVQTDAQDDAAVEIPIVTASGARPADRRGQIRTGRP